jgi:hypothetical protein
MFEIKLFFRKHGSEAEDASPEDKYFPMEDATSVRELLTLAQSGSYNYGKVVISANHQILINAECELDYFISCIQDDKQAIFSGHNHMIDNSYFKLLFHYHDNLVIKAGNKKNICEKTRVY